MKNLEQQFSKDLMITQSSNSVSDLIPIDLIIDIFLRAPAKYIARFRCVSRFWKFILSRPDFSELFLTKSVARPRLFFVLNTAEELFVFSSTQPQNPDENCSLVATPYMGFPERCCSPAETEISTPLYGLVFLQNWGRKALVICNPVSGKSITLPKLKATGTGEGRLGFDPISKQFKVLCTTTSRHGTSCTHRVLTLDTGKRLLWRRIQGPLLPSYLPGCHDDIYINGVIYYRAYISKVIGFDFRSERFGDLINMDEDMLHGQHFTLLNYKGNLAAYEHTYSFRFVLWVLEDAGKHKWSRRECLLPPLFRDEIVNKNRFVGMTGTGELVFSSYCNFLSNSFHVFYYNIERNAITRKINIQGFEEFRHKNQHIFIHTFLDFAENMMFI